MELSRFTFRVLIPAVFLLPGVACAEADAPPNTARLAIGRLREGRFADLPPAGMSLAGGDRPTAQLRDLYARVDYDLEGGDGTIDLVIDWEAGSARGRSLLTGAARAPGGAKQQVLVKLPDWILVPRENDRWVLRARLNPASGVPLLTADADSVEWRIESLRLWPGFTPDEGRELGGPDSVFFSQAMSIRLSRAPAANLKALLFYGDYQPDGGGAPQQTIDLGQVEGDKTVEFRATIPADTGRIVLRFKAEGLPPGDMASAEDLMSRDVVYEGKAHTVTAGSQAPVSAAWAKVDFKPVSVSASRTIRPQIRFATLGSVAGVADAGIEFAGINRVWTMTEIPSNGSFVNDVTFRYTKADLPGDPEFQEANLQVVSWDPSARKLTFHPTTVDAAAGAATARLDGLLPYYSLAMAGPFPGRTLNLPFAGAGSLAGLTLVNASAQGAQVSLTAYDPGGNRLPLPGNPNTAAVAGRQVLAGAPSQIFQEAFPGDGWVQARVSGRGAAAGVTVAAGNEIESVAASAAPAAVLAFTTVEHGDAVSTELHLANPGSFAASARMELRDADGRLVDFQPLNLPAKGKAAAGVASLFRAVPNPFSGSVIVRADHQLSGVAVISSQAALAAIPAQAAGPASRLYAAHVEAGKGALRTRVNLVNAGTAGTVVTIRVIGRDGIEAAAPFVTRIEPNVRVSRDLAGWFDPDGDVFTGSLVIDAAPGVAGDISTSDDAGTARCLVPLAIPRAAQALFQVSGVAGAFTGLALFNPGPTTANISVRGFAPDGSPADGGRIALIANGRYSDLVSRALPSMPQQSGGYVLVQSDQPVVASAMLGSTDLRALAAVESQPVATDSPGDAAAIQPASNTISGGPGPKPPANLPAIEVSPASLDFPSVPVGQIRDLTTLRVRNTGTAPLSVNALATGNPAFIATSPTVPFVLAPGFSQDVTVRFAPATTGPLSATLNVNSTDPARPSVPVALAGTGAPGSTSPAIWVSPENLDFGTVGVKRSKQLPLAIRNAGGGTLNVLSFSSSNPAFDVPKTPFSLAAGAAKDIAVTFAPASAGPQIGRITVMSNDNANSMATVLLSGTGEDVVASGVRIAISPAKLEFGPVYQGQSRELSLTITGTEKQTPLSVTALRIDNPRFQVVNRPVPFGLGLTRLATVQVRFVPDSAGPQGGTLTIESNAENTPSVAVPLSAVGLAVPSEEELKVDDGTFEINSSFGSRNVDMYYMTRLTPTRYPATLKTVRIYWHGDIGGVEAGTNIIVTSAATDNRTIDGLRFTQTPAKVNTLGRFNEYTVPPITITSGDFVVGVTMFNPPDLDPMALDMNSRSQGRSFVGFNGVNFIPTESTVMLGGNLPIRATVTY